MDAAIWSRCLLWVIRCAPLEPPGYRLSPVSPIANMLDSIHGQRRRSERISSDRLDLEVNLFRNRKGVINLDPEIPDGTFNLGVAK